MVITSIVVDFEMMDALSLKDRRKVLNSIRDRLKKFNISFLDLSREYPKEVSFAVCYITHNEAMAKEIKQKIEDFLYKCFPQYQFNFDEEYI